MTLEIQKESVNVKIYEQQLFNLKKRRGLKNIEPVLVTSGVILNTLSQWKLGTVKYLEKVISTTSQF